MYSFPIGYLCKFVSKKLLLYLRNQASLAHLAVVFGCIPEGWWFKPIQGRNHRHLSLFCSFFCIFIQDSNGMDSLMFRLL